MRRYRTVLLIAGVCAECALAACGSATEPVAEYRAQPVVRAYLYAGEPVSDIHLSWTTTLDGADTVSLPINDAQVFLKRNGVTFTLVKAAGDSGYYRYPGSDLVVRSGDLGSMRSTRNSTQHGSRTLET